MFCREPVGGANRWRTLVKGVPEPQEENRLVKSVSKTCPEREGCLLRMANQGGTAGNASRPWLYAGSGGFHIFIHKNLIYFYGRLVTF